MSLSTNENVYCFISFLCVNSVWFLFSWRDRVCHVTQAASFWAQVFLLPQPSHSQNCRSVPPHSAHVQYFFKTVLPYSHATLNTQVPCPSIPFASAPGVCLSAWLFLLVSGWSKAPSLGLKRQLCEECLLLFPRTAVRFPEPMCGFSHRPVTPAHRI